MVSISSQGNHNYQTTKTDIGLSILTLTCIPLAKQNWAKSKENSKYSTLHKIVGTLEFVPALGALIGLIEKVVKFAISLFDNQSDSKKSKMENKVSLTPPSTQANIPNPVPTQSRSNTTAQEFVEVTNAKNFKAISPLKKSEVEAFIKRGGTINIIPEDKVDQVKVKLNKNEPIITGCNSGINRSQVAAGVFKTMNLSVKGVLAGGDSAMNPEAEVATFADPLEKGNEGFKSCFNFSKVKQIGSDVLQVWIEDEKDLKEAKKVYKNFINKLPSTHFVTFGTCVNSTLRRLLEREGSLEGFTITHLPWGDEIAHPPEGIIRYSQEAHAYFAKKIHDCFQIVE